MEELDIEYSPEYIKAQKDQLKAEILSSHYRDKIFNQAVLVEFITKYDKKDEE